MVEHALTTLRPAASPCHGPRATSEWVTQLDQARRYVAMAMCLETVTAGGQSPCRCSSVAKVWFYSIQINILVNLSIIYQYFSMNLFLMCLQ